jgi:hypothetical protein
LGIDEPALDNGRRLHQFPICALPGIIPQFMHCF